MIRKVVRLTGSRPILRRGRRVGGGGAVQEQIGATVKDAIGRAQGRLPRGPGLAQCTECGASIPQARRDVIPGVRLCLSCQDTSDREVARFSGYHRRGSKDSQLR